MIKQTTHIPAGYKPSPLGIIPEDWEVKRLGEIAEIGSGGTPSKSHSEYWNGNIPWVTTSLLNNPYIETAEEYITEEGLHNSSAKMLNEGVLLMAMYGQGQTRGKVSKLLIRASTNQACAYIDVHTGLVDYIHQNLIANYESIRNESNDGNQKNLSLGIISNIRISFPPLPEQRRIVDLLELWDTAIAKQTALIEKLTLRKRGLMQQLLTGKKRLEGFSGEWKRTPIKDFAKEVSVRNSNREDHIVLSCTKYDGLVPSLEYFGKQIYSDDLSSYKKIPQGHFAYATNHIEEGSIGYQSKYEQGLISPMYTVFITDRKKVDDAFLFAVFKSHHLIHLYKSMMEGSINRRGGLRWDSFSTIKINLPPLDEQTAIASVLINADKEIEIQKQKLAAIQEQKKGLMQVLLTGKRRIKIN